jgi:hypothetical protein
MVRKLETCDYFLVLDKVVLENGSENLAIILVLEVLVLKTNKHGGNRAEWF